MNTKPAVMGVSVLLVALVGCGQQHSDMSGVADLPAASSTASDDAPWGQPDAPENKAIRDAATRSYSRWAGSLEMHQALQVVRAHQLNGAFSECLQKHGVNEDWRANISAPHVRRFDKMSAALASPTWRPSDSLPLQARAARSDAWELAYDPPPSTANVRHECRDAHPAPGESGLSDGPEEYEVLEEAWRGRIGGATAQFLDQQDVVECVTRQEMSGPFAGKDADSRFAVVDDAEPPASDVPVGKEQPTEAWRSYRALEQQLLEAHWACRRDVYDEAMATLPAVVAAFEAEYAEEIRRAEGRWASIEDRARALGWTPGEPLAGWPTDKIGY